MCKIVEGPEHQAREFGFYSVGSREPLKDFEQEECKKIRFDLDAC